ncbi:MAG: hypothetical protein COZ46_03855 [Verrucomicrobia bacterium CG_4_10_14_3_um_filter_43_23]|nr:MAG: hypothetical protein COX01_03735 [Verrucomicrobia bacterium CG22_combo_CG10-13_8_21_14_all_43_17]PIX58500.1 MAG: hypothetical protein COZ46_03855 [Verrucomicrobia bacterium CG_4_10_14_3_um_filter_43_23]PIY62249.1 MAG: hypothetical protein COY94_02750 [Verrucomicrobia bacterium CG_4_10_14_0_8_um_filter_43_34]PJA44287.1 MAG: hypothetical protein CO175_03530 [Verrucomicrobia bacterium CG_4_9_14_3_um_filter_43_20]
MKENKNQTDLLNDLQSLNVGDLAKDVFELLVANQKKFAVAESCTGGQLSNVITNIPGISAVYAGGVCSYMNDIKINVLGVPEDVIGQFGAVSEETALAMATGVARLFRVDYAVSTTGYAGPEGGDARNPVGTVCVGVYSPKSEYVRKFKFSGNREAIKASAVKAALVLLIEALQA